MNQTTIHGTISNIEREELHGFNLLWLEVTKTLQSGATRVFPIRAVVEGLEYVGPRLYFGPGSDVAIRATARINEHKLEDGELQIDTTYVAHSIEVLQ